MILQRRRWLTIALAAAFLLAAAAVLASWRQPAPVYAAGGEDDVKRTITVTGVGEITVEPDVAYVDMGIVTRASTAEEAQRMNAQQFAALEKVLFERFKIDKKDVKTTGFYVNPEYSYEEREKPKIVAYSATHMIRVTYRKLDQIGELLDAASKVGVNQINNVQFATEKANEYEMEAMKAAMKNARDKAEVLAAAENVKIREVLNISQSSYIGGPVYGKSYGGFAGNMAAAPEYSTSINSGEITISTQVNVTYGF
jgi:hypothetical protein